MSGIKCLLPLLPLCSVALATNARAETPADGFDLSGSSRLRVETIAGQARTGFNSDDTLINLRTQLLLQFRKGAFEIGAELYDSRAWGANPGTPLTTGEVNALEPVQAYIAADFDDVVGKGSVLRLQAGRFTLNLGSRRLIAADDYRNTTNGYTGLRADLSLASGPRATAIFTLPQARLPDSPDALRTARIELDRERFDQVLWGGLASTPMFRSGRGAPIMGEAGYFRFTERDAPGRPTRDRSLNTVTGRVLAEPKPGRFDFELETMYQWGRISASLSEAAPSGLVSAAFLHAEAGYSLSAPWQPRLSLEFDYASGDGPGDGYGRFDPLFGMRRGDFAPAGLYNAVGRANVLSPAVRVEVTPGRRIDAFVSYRPLWLASAFDAFSTTGVKDANGQSGAFAGHQFDARVRHWLIPQRLRAEINGVVLAKGRFLKQAPNAPAPAATRYLSVNITASF